MAKWLDGPQASVKLVVSLEPFDHLTIQPFINDYKRERTSGP